VVDEGAKCDGLMWGQYSSLQRTLSPPPTIHLYRWVFESRGGGFLCQSKSVAASTPRSSLSCATRPSKTEIAEDNLRYTRDYHSPSAYRPISMNSILHTLTCITKQQIAFIISAFMVCAF
jgi:hypothetical protein